MGNDQQHLGSVAEDSLLTFERIASTASTQLEELRRSKSTAVIASNTFTSGAAINSMAQIQHENLASLQVLEYEPAIARVIVADENDRKRTYYICRTAPPVLQGVQSKIASYHSPVGRIASLPVGAEVTIKVDGKPTSFEIVEYARFQPKKLGADWDAQNSVLQGEKFGPITIDSLRKLLAVTDSPDINDDLLDSLLAEEDAAANIHEGLRRTVISRMDLRDQPILDQYQDDIFRLPLDSRLLILGAPGTGKTTTLIRRLGQKLNIAFLEESEKIALERSPFRGEANHAHSWIMFTPTELLKLYVKEAFNREGIPAPDERISTWAEFRVSLARNDFGILRSASHGGTFVLKPSAQTVTAKAIAEPAEWFMEFDDFQRREFWRDLRDSAEAIVRAPNVEVSQIGRRLLNVINAAGSTPQPDAFLSISKISDQIVPLVNALKAAVEQPIRQSLNVQVSRDKSFRSSFSKFIESLENSSDDSDELDIDDEDEVPQTSTGMRAAMDQYTRAIKSLASARSKKRSIPRASRSGRIIEWIAERGPAPQELLRIGEMISMQVALRRFVNPVRSYLGKIPQRYRQFRRNEVSSQLWYQPIEVPSSEIHPLELDIVLLAVMRSTDELVTGARDLLNREGPARQILEKQIARYRTQVLIDEATDFSPIQLAIMSTLARPGTRSVFACGDFNQRVTSWGSRSIDAVKWAIPRIETRQIAVAYRQSGQLHDLARRIVAANGESAADADIPLYADGVGVSPVLAEHMEHGKNTACWVADRIREIEMFVHELPSIAVLVNSEDDVVPVSDALAEALEDQSIPVTACRNGQVKGNEGSVRVFNVEHIKGLEFEAVFFLGIDGLLQCHPELFNKYLYVGATRAATYFGITCTKSLPPQLESLRTAFCESWEHT